MNSEEFYITQSHSQPNTQPNHQHSIMGHSQKSSPVSDMFFSKENIIRIQKTIKREIFRRTNGNFKMDVDQDEASLLIPMRAMYIEYGRNLPTNIVHQVKQLNKITVDFIVPDMITEIKQGYNYLKEINEPVKPIALPINVNVGKQILPSYTTLYHD